MSNFFLTAVFTLIVISNVSGSYNWVQLKFQKDNAVNKKNSYFTNSYNKIENFKENAILSKPFKKIDKTIQNQKERVEIFNYQIVNENQSVKYEDLLNSNKNDKIDRMENFKSNKKTMTKKPLFIEMK